MGRSAILTEYGSPPGSVEELTAIIAAWLWKSLGLDAIGVSGNYVPGMGWCWIVGTYPDEQYVIVTTAGSVGDEYWRYDYQVSEDGTEVTFGDGVRLEVQFVPADVMAEAARLRMRHMDGRQRVAEAVELREASLDKAGKTLAITVIQEGFNTSRTRYYTAEALRSGVAAFAGPLKMYCNHQTGAEEKARPEGDLHDWVATLTEVAYDANGKRLRGVAKVTDPEFMEKLALLDEQGLLNTLGVSIRAVGAGETATIEGTQTFRVDEFTAARSVDFVTEPGAGGFVEWRESAEADDIDVISLARLRERRPDLVEAITRESHQEVSSMDEKELVAEREARMAAEQRAREAEERAAAAESAAEALRGEQALHAAQESIGRLISESKLPEPSQAFLRESLASETDVEKAKTTIESHAKYVASLTGKGEVRGNGDTTTDVSEADLEQKFGRFNLSEAGARAAATGRA